MTAYIGIDFSLTATGVAVYRDGKWTCATIKTETVEGIDGFLERIAYIAREIDRIAKPKFDDIIAIESPAFGAKSSNLDKMFGGWWLIVQHLNIMTLMPIITFAPTEVKKMATGNGGASKEAVLINTIRMVPESPVDDNNQADATWLAVGASHSNDQPIVPFSPDTTKKAQKAG